MMVKFQLNPNEQNSGPSNQLEGGRAGKSQQEIEDEIFEEHSAVSERTPLLATSKDAPLYSDTTHARAGASTNGLSSTQDPVLPKHPEFLKVIKKWWQDLSTVTKWVIITTIIFVFQLLFFIISLKVVAPITTRNAIEQAELDFNSIEVKTSGSSFSITGNATISNLGNVKITSDPVDLDVYYLSNLLGNIALPSLTLSPQNNQFLINSTLHILQPIVMEKFANDMIFTDSLEWDLQGKMNFYSKAADIKQYSLNKKIALTGFNGVKDIQLSTFSLNSDNFNHGISFLAGLSFWNPSNVTLHPGDLAFGLYYQGFQIAHGSTVDPVVTPGENELIISGNMASISDDTVYMTDFLNRYLKGDLLQVEVRGLDSKSAPWLHRALQNIQTKVQVLGKPEPIYITDMSLANTSIEFDDEGYAVFLNGVLEATLKLPTVFKSLPIRLKQTSEVCVYRLEKCVPFAKFYIPSCSMETVAENGFTSIKAELAEIRLVALPEAQEEFSQVIEEFFTSDNLIFQVTGHTTITTETAIGLLDLELDSFTEFVDLKGLFALQHPPIHVENTQMSKASQDLSFESKVILHSSSNVLVKLGPVMLDLMYSDIKIGETWIPNLQIHPGENSVDVYTQLTISNDPQLNHTINEMFSQHIQGVDLTFTVKGTSDSSDIEPLSRILQQYSHTFTIPGYSRSLVEATAFHMFFGSISTQITNPIKELPLKIRALNSTLTIENHKVGDVNVQFREDSWFTPLNIPPNKSSRTPRLPVSFTEDGHKKLKANQGNEVELDIEAKIQVEVNKVQLFLTYKESGIVTKVNGWFFSE
ncbi:hypothetical protein K7432_000780 [Basidiobolus ranarum]|uniref:Tag1-like fifth Ig-like domain-containing protein n=1 Tax=Basidiobolus ranarum TaxID=34480 RepID=A0ABR2WAQ7_9FUNG